MEKRELEKGDVVQIDPRHDGTLGGSFMQITDPKPWGAQGFIAIPGKKGSVYYRCSFENMEFVGHATWIQDE